ncbi:hypothetical protein Godav_001299 [Gossypium davidsonii]|uniref:Peptidase A1 domain-containing protein n=2 Tax=Gossypium TaxID=3633 RepID=A0A7J8T3E8_GOSDV|nr:hypothetical protein [Gossypium davidsonii]MBA0668381.1 hypothetical protein [Gossypium klotzschianum]
MSLSLRFLSAKLFLCLCLTLFQHHVTFSASNPTGLTLRAVLDDSPNSPLYLIENMTIAERIERFIQVTNAKDNYLNLNARVGPDNSNSLSRVVMARDGLFYSVWLLIGSQGQEVKLLMDTGGGLTWTQCQPCLNCFPQNLPIYDSRASTTYSTLSCDHPLCQVEGSLYTCVDDLCIFVHNYHGGLYTTGVASLETFYFPMDPSTALTFNNLVFGCSRDSRNVVFQDTELSGIFGMNMMPDSLMSQLSSFTNFRFSYCLVPFPDLIPHTLFLRFGDDIPLLPPERVKTTMFVHAPYLYNYYVNLVTISFLNDRLGFPPSQFQLREDGLGGCFVDSGYLLTAIEDNYVGGVNAYDVLMDLFTAYYESNNLRRTTDPSGLDMCFERPNDFNNFANLTFHFDGEADYFVPPQHLHIFQQDHFCVAITRGRYATVLGAWQQQNKRMLYDVGLGRLQFADENCAND